MSTAIGKLKVSRVLGAIGMRIRQLMLPLNNWLGRRIFGNTNWLTINLKGVWDERRFATSLTTFGPADTRVDAVALPRTSCAVLP